MLRPSISRIIVLVTACVFCPLGAAADQPPSGLGRGLVAVAQGAEGAFLSWRTLASDPAAAAFDLERVLPDGTRERVTPQPLTGVTCYQDPKPGAVEYHLRRLQEGQQQSQDAIAKVWSQDYLQIPIHPIEGYRPGDASVGDLNGDGQWEIVLHQAGRGRDNGSAGVTSPPVLDAYTLDGRLLWRINLGKNIREGEHYTQFMVYDLDGDGRAEVACKTADGAIDGQGNTIGDAQADWRTLREGSPRHGRVLDGPEYLTIFDGQTGAALATTDYVPSRDPVDGWGGIGGNAGNDNYGNRCDRFLACIAYLDGQRPSLIMCRGVYGRTALVAWDWRKGRLTERWRFDTGPSMPPYDEASPYAGMGGHNLSVADIDDDGRDEIVYQAMVIDDNGEGLYSTGLRHGDSMMLTDIDPTRPGQEVYTVQENEDHAERFQTPAAAYRDARTGRILWSHDPTRDAPSGLAADIDPRHYGLEMWGGPGGLRNVHGEEIGAAPRISDWCIWWDGDPLRELLTLGRPGWNPPPRNSESDARRRRRRRWRPRDPTPTRVVKWDWQRKSTDTVYECDAHGAARGPALVGDLLGDWREELLLVSPDRQSLRLYTTTIPTEHQLRSLLEDRQYRLALAWQNVVYNKPPQVSYYLGAEPPASQPDTQDAPAQPSSESVSSSNDTP